MKTYWTDANIWLRLLLGDVLQQQAQAEKYVRQAQAGKIRLVLCGEVVMEVVFVLTKFYHLSRGEVADKLSLLLGTRYVDVPERDILLHALGLYARTKLDFVDVLLHARAQEHGAQVLTFDEALKKLAGWGYWTWKRSNARAERVRFRNKWLGVSG